MAENIVDTKKKEKKQKRRVDTPLLIVTFVLVVFGLIMMFSASYANAWYMFGDSYHYIKNQLLFAVIGIAAMLVISRINYHILHKFAWILYLVSVVLLVITLFMPPINNSKRWIILPGLPTFQPSELAKFAIILLFSHIASIKNEKMKEFKYGFLQPIIIMGVIAAIMLQQPHLSGTILILMVGSVLMLIAGTKFRWFGIAGAIAVPLGVAFIFFSDKMEYAMSRINMWIDPFQDRTGDGHQIIQSLLAIGSGGIMGLGLGNSRQKHLYVPEPQNDFIFSIICEELGFVGALFIIILFLVFVFRGFAVAMKAPDRFGALLTIGITCQIGIQAMLNIAVVSGTVPNTGISLPFFSQGGTSLAMLLAEVGVMLSVSRYSSIKKL